MLRTLLNAIGVILMLALPASAQTADEIIAKNLQAKGGVDKLKSIATLRMSGTMTVEPGRDAPFVMELKRPNQMRVDITVQGRTMTQAFDGKVGWTLGFDGGNWPVPMPAEAVKALEAQADFDGPLVDYQAKGSTVELVGKEAVNGTDAYKVKLTMKSGEVRYYYFDATRYLEIKVEGTMKVQGKEVVNEGTFGDYKDVDGLVFPHTTESGQKETPLKQKRTVQKLEINVPIDDSRFRSRIAIR